MSGVRGGDLLAAYAEWLHEPIRRALANVAPWNAAWSGQYWASWFAWASWFRDVGQLELKGDLWDRFAAQEATAACNYLWWHGPFCIAADRPTALHVENDGGVNRLHCEDGPAVQWADGWGIYAWHGTQVPPDLIEGDGWDVERIAREPNVEVRRCAAERMGWPTFLSTAGVMVGEPADDPGNPGRKLTLYDTRFPLYAEPVRLLHCINASPMADGTHREYVLSVDADHDDPVSAAAAKLSLTRDQYLQFGRAT